MQYRAFYEDAARTEAAARKEGYDGENGSLMDYVEPSDYRTGKTFKTLALAEFWLIEQIQANKTVFGCGNIIEQEPIAKRCRYCICNGIRDVHEYTIEEEGMVSDEEIESGCLD